LPLPSPKVAGEGAAKEAIASERAMNFWIFKLAEQSRYADEHGKTYAFDNTHSRKVQDGDLFLYLDKEKDYSFTATGMIEKVVSRDAKPTERTNDRVRIIHEAKLADLITFRERLTISPRTRKGQANRARLRLHDVNSLGWGISIPRLTEDLYERIVNLAEEVVGFEPDQAGAQDYSIEDHYSRTKKRKKRGNFNSAVFKFCRTTCVICGTRQREVLHAAHLSPWAEDVANRANPHNGICLCGFCHLALDAGLFSFKLDGTVESLVETEDEMVWAHLRALAPEARRSLLGHIDPELYEKRFGVPERELSELAKGDEHAVVSADR
jgi:hypothetical protein